jgi:hypothetical protein
MASGEANASVKKVLTKKCRFGAESNGFSPFLIHE